MIDKTEQLRAWWYSDDGRLPIARIMAWVRKRNPDGVPTYNRARPSASKENNRKYQRDWNKRHPSNLRGIKYHISHAISANMNQSLHNKNRQKWELLVGYTVERLIRHLERQFLDGMSWDNYGEWHIDHIIPQSAFHFTSPEDIDFKRCWALNNLQPLWATDNVVKGAKISKPFQPSLKIR